MYNARGETTRLADMVLAYDADGRHAKTERFVRMAAAKRVAAYFSALSVLSAIGSPALRTAWGKVISRRHSAMGETRGPVPVWTGAGPKGGRKLR